MTNNVIPIATYIILFVVVVAGAIVCIVSPATLSFEDYVRDVSIAAAGLAIGRGLDSSSRP